MSSLKRELNRLAHVDLGIDEDGNEKTNVYKTTLLDTRLRARSPQKANVYRDKSESPEDTQTDAADNAQTEDPQVAHDTSESSEDNPAATTLAVAQAEEPQPDEESIFRCLCMLKALSCIYCRASSLAFSTTYHCITQRMRANTHF